MSADDGMARGAAAGEIEAGGAAAAPRPITLFLAFLRLGATAFGGPAMVPYIGELAVRRRRWLGEEAFREGVALCQAVPGATAMQTAAYVGLRAGGVRGAAAAYAGFALPAALLMVAASVAYARVGGLATVQAVFRGFQVVVVALVTKAALRFGRAHLRSPSDGALALGSGVALWARASPALVIAVAALLSVALRWRSVAARPDGAGAAAGGASRGPQVTARTVAAIVAAGGTLLVVLLALAPRLGALAAVCMKVNLLAFGGGFASVPLLFREVVTVRAWLDAQTFMDGVALGQVTPGPIGITATFVGYQLAGPAGALVATWAIFFPSFVIVLVAAPSFSGLRARAWFEPALHGALLSFVGLLGAVALQFAGAVSWTPGALALAAAALGALLAGVDVLWVVLAAGAFAAVAL